MIFLSQLLTLDKDSHNTERESKGVIAIITCLLLGFGRMIDRKRQKVFHSTAQIACLTILAQLLMRALLDQICLSLALQMYTVHVNT